jgi:hypothetical protein
MVSLPRLLPHGQSLLLLIETPNGHLSIGMRQLKGTYPQRFNCRHNRTGHLFQGRFKAILGEAKVRPISEAKDRCGGQSVICLGAVDCSLQCAAHIGSHRGGTARNP